MTTLRAIPHRRRGGFTLVEVIMAVIVATFVLGVVWTSLSQFARARSVNQLRMNAHLRADAAMEMIRRDVAAVIRSDDLFWTRLRLLEDVRATPTGLVDRDELLVYNLNLDPIREIRFDGEGIEYETHYRIEDSDIGPVLWRRRDPVPDENYEGGGLAMPMLDQVSGLMFEAYDGGVWRRNWDSDQSGLPLAVRITVTVPVTGEIGDRPVVLRTVVAIERVLPPFDTLMEQPESEAE